MKISTSCICPPIPTRNFDWTAIDSDTYDGEGCLQGFGPTEEDAIIDLVRQIVDETCAFGNLT